MIRTRHLLHVAARGQAVLRGVRTVSGHQAWQTQLPLCHNVSHNHTALSGCSCSRCAGGRAASMAALVGAAVCTLGVVSNTASNHSNNRQLHTATAVSSSNGGGKGDGDGDGDASTASTLRGLFDKASSATTAAAGTVSDRASATASRIMKQGASLLDRHPAASQSPSSAAAANDSHHAAAASDKPLDKMAAVREVVGALQRLAERSNPHGRTTASGVSVAGDGSDDVDALWWVVGLKMIADNHRAQQEAARTGALLGDDAGARAADGATVRELFSWTGPADAMYTGSQAKFLSALHSMDSGTTVSEGDILVSQWASAPHRPAHCIYIDHKRKAIVVAVRGTKEIHDVLTDLALETTPFRGSYAHQGMVLSAQWLVNDRILPTLEKALAAKPALQQYELVVTGHSLGAGVSALATQMLRDVAAGKGATATPALRELSGHARCVCFATPACMSPYLALQSSSYTLGVVLGADVVPRASESAYAEFVRELEEFATHEAARASAAVNSVKESVDRNLQSARQAHEDASARLRDSVEAGNASAKESVDEALQWASGLSAQMRELGVDLDRLPDALKRSAAAGGGAGGDEEAATADDHKAGGGDGIGASAVAALAKAKTRIGSLLGKAHKEAAELAAQSKAQAEATIGQHRKVLTRSADSLHASVAASAERLSSVADSLASLSERIKSRAAAAGDKDTASAAGSSAQGAGATEQSQPLLPLVTAAQAYHVAYEAPRKRLTLKGPTTEGGRAVVREAKVADFATLVLAPTMLDDHSMDGYRASLEWAVKQQETQ